VGLQGPAVFGAGVLHSAIGVEDQLGWRLAMFPGHVPSHQNQRGIDAFAHRPADNAAAIEIHSRGQESQPWAVWI
jgi:hypothetical protein